MGWDGGGGVTLLYDWGTRRDAGAPDHFITADEMDAQQADIASAIEATLNRNGENAMAADFSMASNQITSLGDPAAATDAINASSVAENTVQYGGTTGGSSGAFTVTNAFIATVGTGTRLLCLANHGNTGAATMNVNGGGATAIVQRDGTSALTGGEIVSGDFFEVAYDGTSWVLLTQPLLTVFNPPLKVGDNSTITAGANADLLIIDDGEADSGLSILSTSTGNIFFGDAGDADIGQIVYTHSTNAMSFTVNAQDQMTLTDGVFGPTTDSDVDLGATGTRWKDAYVDSVTVTGDVTVGNDVLVASGGILNFNSGDVTITHSSNLLTMAGGDLNIGSGDLVLTGYVGDASTGALTMPVGTQAQRPTPASGMIRLNTTTSSFEGYDGSAWTAVGGGPSFGNNAVIRANDQQVLESVTLRANAATFTTNFASDANQLSVSGHALSDGQVVRVSTTGTLPTGLSVDTDYYVKNSVASTSVELATTYDGTLVTLTGDGSGTHTIYRPQNGSSVGDITIESGVTVTISSGSVWTIL